MSFNSPSDMFSVKDLSCSCLAIQIAFNPKFWDTSPLNESTDASQLCNDYIQFTGFQQPFVPKFFICHLQLFYRLVKAHIKSYDNLCFWSRHSGVYLFKLSHESKLCLIYLLVKLELEAGQQLSLWASDPQ